MLRIPFDKLFTIIAMAREAFGSEPPDDEADSPVGDGGEGIRPSSEQYDDHPGGDFSPELFFDPIPLLMLRLLLILLGSSHRLVIEVSVIRLYQASVAMAPSRKQKGWLRANYGIPVRD